MSGRNAQIRGGRERSAGVPGTEVTHFPFASETLDMAYTNEPDPNIDPSGNETSGDTLKGEGSGNITAAPDSESWLLLREQMHGYHEVSEPVTDVHLHEFRDEEVGVDTPLAYYHNSMWFGVWRAESENPSEYVVTDARANQMKLSVDANKHVSMEHQILFRRDRLVRKPFEQAVNAAWTGDIEVIGHPSLYIEDVAAYAAAATEGFYKFKVPVGGGGAIGVAKYVWGKGSGAYGTTEYLTSTVMDVMNGDDDSIAGTPAIPFQIIHVAGGVLTAGDEFRIYPLATKAVAVFSDRPKLNGAAAEFTFSLGGGIVEGVIEAYTITHGVPMELDFGVGSIYAQGYKQPANAKHWWEITIARKYAHTKLKQAMIQKRNIEIYTKLSGALIGSTGQRDYAEFTFDNTEITGAGATVTSAGDLPENLTLRARQVAGSPFCVERYQNTVESIAPA